jgi:hypothetical protein
MRYGGGVGGILAEKEKVLPAFDNGHRCRL